MKNDRADRAPLRGHSGIRVECRQKLGIHGINGRPGGAEHDRPVVQGGTRRGRSLVPRCRDRPPVDQPGQVVLHAGIAEEGSFDDARGASPSESACSALNEPLSSLCSAGLAPHWSAPFARSLGPFTARSRISVSLKGPWGCLTTLGSQCRPLMRICCRTTPRNWRNGSTCRSSWSWMGLGSRIASERWSEGIVPGIPRRA